MRTSAVYTQNAREDTILYTDEPVAKPVACMCVLDLKDTSSDVTP